MNRLKTPSPFNLIFMSVLALTLGSGGTAVHLGQYPTLTESQDRIFDSAVTMWTMGATTLIGLLSNQSEDKDDD
ncbi:MAG: hypothetical protein AAF821_02840 [Cyanobacteria bacterium P01_D01_bin.156]